jgi:hypothetical protein
LGVFFVLKGFCVAKLSFNEKHSIESLFGSGSGYVLDFTDRTFQEFFQEFNIDIESPIYHDSDSRKSKGKRLKQ